MAGDGSGVFASSVNYLAADVEVDSIHPTDFGDFNEDGVLDIVGGNYGNSLDGGGPVGGVSLFLGDGVGGFGAEVSIPATEQTVGVSVADFDGDSHMDLFTSLDRGEYRGKILFGTGNGQLSGSHLLLEGAQFQGLVADLDGDARPDLVTQSGDAVRVYLNRWTTRPS